MYDLVDRFGRGWNLVAQKPPVTCAECGSRHIGWIVAPDEMLWMREGSFAPRNFRADRAAEDRAAALERCGVKPSQ